MKKVFLIISTGMLTGILSTGMAGVQMESDTSSIATDSVTITIGKISFTKNCTSCHNFKQDGIGPQLAGLTAKVSVDWIQKFIKAPNAIIESGDERANNLVKKFHAIMPSYAYYSDKEIDAIIAFLHTQKVANQNGETGDGSELSNPVPEPIGLSDLVVGLELVTQIPPSAEKLPITRITKLEFQPNTQNIFILDLRGKLYKLVNKQPTVYMDMAKLKPKFIDQPGLATGFGSFAFHPEFRKNGLLYTTHTEPPGSAHADFHYADSIPVTLQWVLTEWKTKPGSFPFSGSSRELFRVNMVTGIHGVQEITFNPLAKPGDDDYGLLYVGVGDGGCVEEGFPFLAHSRERIWGTIVRIDPMGRNSANFQYGIPRNNPFSGSGETKTLGEIYAYGFRNPHKISWTPSHQMMAINIGQHAIEALNIILPGHDYGWPIREGTFFMNPKGDINKVYPLPANDSIYRITYPVAQYDHDEGKAISGGFEYNGAGVPLLKGKYLFGDVANGRLFYVDMAHVRLGHQEIIKEWQVSLNGVRKTLAELCKDERPDLRFGKDHRGELYIMTKTDGKVYRLVSASHP